MPVAPSLRPPYPYIFRPRGGVISTLAAPAFMVAPAPNIGSIQIDIYRPNMIRIMVRITSPASFEGLITRGHSTSVRCEVQASRAVVPLGPALIIRQPAHFRPKKACFSLDIFPDSTLFSYT